MLSRNLAVAVTAVVLGSCPGCSFAFVDGPPPNHAARRYFDCTSSYLAPGVDSTLAGLFGIGVLGSMGDSSFDTQSTVEGTIFVGVALASATYGFLRASRCREAKEALAERLLEPAHVIATRSRFEPSGGSAAPAPVLRDPWRSEGLPPGGGDWGVIARPSPDAGAGDAGGQDRGEDH